MEIGMLSMTLYVYFSCTVVSPNSMQQYTSRHGSYTTVRYTRLPQLTYLLNSITHMHRHVWHTQTGAVKTCRTTKADAH